MKAIAPNEMPAMPDRAVYWARSTKRADSVFHAHVIGIPVCGARIYLDRFRSEPPNGLGSMQYHGVCPRCYKLSLKAESVS